MPAVPEGKPLSSSIVVVVPDVNDKVCGGLETEMLLKVFAPVKDNLPFAVVFMKVMAGQVNPPPVKVLVFVVLPPILISQLAVVRSTLKFVPVLTLNTVVSVVSVVMSFPPLILDFIVRMLALLEENSPTVSCLPFKSRVPFVRFRVLVEAIVRSSANCQVPPTPSKVKGLSYVFPLVVMTFVPEVALNCVMNVVDGMVIVGDQIKFP